MVEFIQFEWPAMDWLSSSRKGNLHVKYLFGAGLLAASDMAVGELVASRVDEAIHGVQLLQSLARLLFVSDELVEVGKVARQP